MRVSTDRGTCLHQQVFLFSWLWCDEVSQRQSQFGCFVCVSSVLIIVATEIYANMPTNEQLIITQCTFALQFGSA